ncbi:MAG TPA: hypothetical protein VGG54_22750 [Trebonia sp.]|jgi:hypothetical protein
MVVIMANRQLAVRARIVRNDSHGDRVAAGFGDPGQAYPGLAQEQGDTPLGTPGDRTWVLDLDPAVWPVAQQDMVVDTVSGQQWNVTSAQLMTNVLMPFINHVRCEARLYAGGSGA